MSFTKKAMRLFEVKSAKSKKGPFHGGIKTKGITKKHTPLIWESMLGTVNARSPEGVIKYFDYDYDAAHDHAKTNEHHDLRIAKIPQAYNWAEKGSQVGKNWSSGKSDSSVGNT